MERRDIMAETIYNSTPARDGFHMPAEFEPQERVWMLWPQRPDNWRDGAKPAQEAYTEVAKAISRFVPVTMCVNGDQYQNAREKLPSDIQVVEMSGNDAWMRDMGPAFVVNEEGLLRGCDWRFNAWGGFVDGLYFPWDKDDQIAGKVCEMIGADYYRLPDFVLEGGSFHVDGEGTVLTTKMCLLSRGRNPHMTQEQIAETLCDYLGADKVLWLSDGIDPE